MAQKQTWWNGEGGKTGHPPNQTKTALALPSSQALDQGISAQIGRHLNGTEQQLREVDAQAERADVQAQAVVQQTN